MSGLDFTVAPDQPFLARQPPPEPLPPVTGTTPVPAAAPLDYTIAPQQPFHVQQPPATTTTIAQPDPTVSGLVPPAGDPNAMTDPMSGLYMPPPATEPAPFVDTGQGFMTGLQSGWQRSLQDVARTATGQAFTPDPHAIPEPQDPSFMYKVGRGIGSSGLTFGTTAAGASIGGTYGGLPGAIVGGAVGGGFGGLVQDLAPAYVAGFQKFGNHDDAVNYAWERAVLTGGINATLNSLGAAIPIKNVAGNLLAQIFAVNPIAGATQRVVTPAIMGDPIPSAGEVAAEVPVDILTGAAMTAPFAVAHGVRTPPPQPVHPALDAAARQQFSPMGQEYRTERVMPPAEPQTRIQPEGGLPYTIVRNEPTGPGPVSDVVPTRAVVTGQPPGETTPTMAAEVPVTATIPTQQREAQQQVTLGAAEPVRPMPEGQAPLTTDQLPGPRPPIAPIPAEPIPGVSEQRPPVEPVSPMGAEAGTPAAEMPVARPAAPVEAVPPETRPAEAQPAVVEPTTPQEPITTPEVQAPVADTSPVRRSWTTKTDRMLELESEQAAQDAAERLGLKPDQYDLVETPRGKWLIYNPSGKRAIADRDYNAGRAEPMANTVAPAGEEALAPDRATRLTLPEVPLTAEPDHVVANQFVAKDPDGEVVGKGPTAEAAIADGRSRLNDIEAGLEPRPMGEAGLGLRPEEPTARPAGPEAGLAEPAPTGPRTTGPEVQAGETPVAQELPKTSETPETPVSGRSTELLSDFGRAQVQGEALQKTRDELAAKPNRTLNDEVRLNQMDRQLERLTQAADTRRSGGRIPKRPWSEQYAGREPDFYDYKYNDGTSVYRTVFHETGHDPNTIVSRPITEQNDILSRHLQTKYGFRSVEVLGRNVDQKRGRDALLDMHRAMGDMAAALGEPFDAMSLGAKTRLVIDPAGSVKRFGQYDPATQTLRVSGGANSFGHEWIHAVDHMLAERLTGNPASMNALLSQYTRASGADVTDNVQAATAKLINILLYDEGALAARRLALETTAQRTLPSGRPTQEALRAQAQLTAMDAGASQLHIQPSIFRSEALSMPGGGGYYAKIYELLARSGEAYIARQMQNNGVDPRGVVMPDEAYINTTDTLLRKLYPKDDDRAAIFKGWADVFQAMRNEQILSQGKPAGDFFNYGVSDPSHWSVTAPGAANTPEGRATKATVDAYNQVVRQLAIYDTTRPNAPPGDEWSRKVTNMGRAYVYSNRGIMQTVIDAAPPAAKPYLQEVMDRFTPSPGRGRYTGRAFEEAWRYNADRANAELFDVYKRHGLIPDTMSDEQENMLRHNLVTGDITYPVDPANPIGATKVIPSNILQAAGEIRGQLDKLWSIADNAGLKIGYAANGFFPRMYDTPKILAEPGRFTGLSKQVYGIMFDNEIGAPGTNPIGLVEKWNGLASDHKQMIGLGADMGVLKRYISREAELREKAANPQTPLTRAETAELARLPAQQEALARRLHEPFKDALSTIDANDWLSRIKSSGMFNFDQVSFGGKFLKPRALPPEADLLLRDFMYTSPSHVLPLYNESLARRVAYAERFGPDGEQLKSLLQGALDHGVSRTDANLFESAVNSALGHGNKHRGDQFQQASDLSHAFGNLALMGRAMYASLAEPMTAGMVTLSHGTGLGTALQVGSRAMFGTIPHLWRSASVADRTEMAQLIGVVTSPVHDNMIPTRYAADYSDRPMIQRFLTKFYKLSGLQALTNVQRASTMAAQHWYLGKLARLYLDTGDSPRINRLRDGATRAFNELGVNPALHERFANWMVDLGGDLPSIKTMQTDPLADAWTLAVRRLVDRTIQAPYKVDLPMSRDVPSLGLATQLMSFTYAFQNNVLSPIWQQTKHQYGRAKLGTEARGGGRIAQEAAGLTMGGGTLAMATVMAGAMMLAQTPMTLLRELMFNFDTLEQKAKEGKLLSHLASLAFQRTGLSGTWDPLVQIVTHLKYQSDISSINDGASLQYLFKNMQDVINPYIKGGESPNTNTARYNQAKAAYNLVGVPLAAIALVKLAGRFGRFGLPVTVPAAVAMQYLTSAGASRQAAELAVQSPKGAKLPTPHTGLPELPKIGALPKVGELPKIGAKPPKQPPSDWGLVGNISVPAIRAAWEGFLHLPGPAKLAAGAAGLGYGIYDFVQDTRPFYGRPAPPKKPVLAH